MPDEGSSLGWASRQSAFPVPATAHPSHSGLLALPADSFDLGASSERLAGLASQVGGLLACLQQLGPWCACAALRHDVLGPSEGQAGLTEGLLPSRYGAALAGEGDMQAEEQPSEEGIRWGAGWVLAG